MKTAEWHRRGCSGDFIVKLKKKYTFLPFSVWISEFRMGGYFLKICILNRQFKKISERTVLNFLGNRDRVTSDIWPTWLKILLKNLPLFDWRYIKSCQIGIKQLSWCVILNLRYHLNDSRMKWYRRSVNPNPILFYRKQISRDEQRRKNLTSLKITFTIQLVFFQLFAFDLPGALQQNDGAYTNLLISTEISEVSLSFKNCKMKSKINEG